MNSKRKVERRERWRRVGREGGEVEESWKRGGRGERRSGGEGRGEVEERGELEEVGERGEVKER